MLLKQYFFSFILLLVIIFPAKAQPGDSAGRILDTVIIIPALKRQSPLEDLLKENRYLNSSSKPVSLAERPKKRANETGIFYILAGLMFLFGIIKTIYARYFSTLFRVFF